MTILILSEGQGRRLINDDRLQFLDISESKARSSHEPHPVTQSRQNACVCSISVEELIALSGVDNHNNSN